MKRWFFLLYGVVGHLCFLATYAWLAGFVGNLAVPHPIDAVATGPLVESLAVDLGLIALFAVQHSVMARPSFKKMWTRLVPHAIERSTYVYAACMVTVLLMWLWRPVNLVVWDVQQRALRIALYGLFAAGWLLVPAVSLMINHFDLIGTRQVWLYFRGREYAAPAFRTPLLYSRVRHPLYVGWTIAFWATPTMTVGHLVFAAAMTGYMLLAVVFEERDLVEYFGRQYEEYQRNVPMFFPWGGRPIPAPTFDWSIMTDLGWIQWAATVLLLAAHLSGVVGTLPAAMVLCALVCALDFARQRSLRALSVQIRLVYLVLLAAGTLPGVAWIHWVQLVGTSALVSTGYCFIARVLSLLPMHRTDRLTWSHVRIALFAVPTEGGLLRFAGEPGNPQSGGVCMLRACDRDSRRASSPKAGPIARPFPLPVAGKG